MNVRRTIAASVLIAAALPLATATPALAKDGDVRVSGNCSASTDWKLKVKPDNGRIEFEGEIDSNKVGQTWAWKIKHNGTVSETGSAKTKAPSGSFSVNRRLSNLAGVDTFTFVAKNAASGETCNGTVKI